MGLRFRKSIKIAPGLKLNINKKSIGLSAGVRGAHVSVNSNGTKTVSAGLPGTGVSYVKSFGKGKKGNAKKGGLSNIFKYVGIIFMIALIAIAVGKAWAKKNADAPAAASSSAAVTAESLPADGITESVAADGIADSSAAGQSATAAYILNTSSKKIHLPTCSSVEKIDAENRAETNKSVEELSADGYTPCGTCMK